MLRGNRYRVHGLELQVPTSVDAEIRYLLLRGRPYEQAEADLTKSALKPGMNVLELGGSIGVISAVVRSVIGPVARHVIVEANADLAEICRLNASRGANDGAVKVVWGAIDYTGNATVSFDLGHNSHTGRVAETGGTAVPALTASDAAKFLPNGAIALVCDIEGAEFPMVMHDDALLGRCSVIIMEIHPPYYATQGGSTASLVEKLARHGLLLRRQIDDVLLFQR